MVRNVLTCTAIVCVLAFGFPAAAFAQDDAKRDANKAGAEAYGDRFGNSYARHLIRGTLEYGASAILREDNRYVPSLDTGFWKRTSPLSVTSTRSPWASSLAILAP